MPDAAPRTRPSHAATSSEAPPSAGAAGSPARAVSPPPGTGATGAPGSTGSGCSRSGPSEGLTCPSWASTPATSRSASAAAESSAGCTREDDSGSTSRVGTPLRWTADSRDGKRSTPGTDMTPPPSRRGVTSTCWPSPATGRPPGPSLASTSSAPVAGSTTGSAPSGVSPAPLDCWPVVPPSVSTSPATSSLSVARSGPDGTQRLTVGPRSAMVPGAGIGTAEELRSRVTEEAWPGR